MLRLVCASFSGDLVETEKKQPSTMERKMCILRFPGRIVTLRGYKQASSRKVRTTTMSEFDEAIEELRSQGYGCVVKIRAPRSAKESTIFIKSDPKALPPERSLIPLEEYRERYGIQVHSSVTDGMKRVSIEKGHVENDFFD